MDANSQNPHTRAPKCKDGSMVQDQFSADFKMLIYRQTLIVSTQFIYAQGARVGHGLIKLMARKSQGDKVYVSYKYIA